MKEGLIKNTWELFLKEIQTILSLLYLLMIGIGMIFNYKKYINFGINIFEYADIFHFLIAPFQDIRIIMVSVISLLIPLSVYGLRKAFYSQFPKLGKKLSLGLRDKSWYQKARIIFWGLIIIFFISEAALGYANFIKNNLDFQPSVSITYADNEKIQGQLLGKTKEVLFLHQAGKVKVIMITAAVKEIEIL
ncbi:MAG: hypothetical protein R8P61_17840 [Bacteroidia bacterium]|nr:hypothetical protein [Bacteroidia bacterium]